MMASKSWKWVLAVLGVALSACSARDASQGQGSDAPQPGPSGASVPDASDPDASTTPPTTAGATTYTLAPVVGDQQSLSHVIQGRQEYSHRHVMWKDPSGHIHLINSFGGSDGAGDRKAYLHYVNTFTGAHALVEGGPCAMGRRSVYDPVHDKVYWNGEYCSDVTGGGFNEFDPVTMTNTVIALGAGSPKWMDGLNIRLGKDNKIYFIARDADALGAHLFSYDPAVGASSWTDYGVVYGHSDAAPPGLFVDSSFIYVGWQDVTPDHFFHLMIHPIGSGTWTEQSFPKPSTVMLIDVDEATSKAYMRRVGDDTTGTNYWLQGGRAVSVTGTQPATGPQWVLDLNQYHLVQMEDYGAEFIQAFNYDMNWDDWMPDPAKPVSTVYYGPAPSFNYPSSGFSTSSLTYTGPWYDMPVNSIAPKAGGTEFYALDVAVSHYDYTAQTGAAEHGLPRTSTYHALRVPAAASPLGVEEIYRSGYPNKLSRWNPAIPPGPTNPTTITLPQDMDYRLFMDYDSEGTIWVGSNKCGATPGCIDYGSIAWHKPSDGSVGEMFQGAWTGGNPPATGNGIQFRNFTMSNGRTKLVVSSNDGRLTVVNALTKTIEGSYSLGNKAYMVEVANDRVLGVTPSTTTTDAQVFLFEPSTRTMVVAPQSTGVAGYNFGSVDGHWPRHHFRLELGPDGHAWLFVSNALYRVDPTTLAFQHVADEPIYSKIKFADNNVDLLFYDINASVKPGANIIKGILVPAH